MSFNLQLLWEVEAYAKAAGVPRASLMSSSSSGASVSMSAGPMGLQPCAPNAARDPGEEDILSPRPRTSVHTGS